MTDWSTLKKLIWLRIIKGGGSALRTVTGAIVHVTNALALPAEALTVNVEPIQDLHGYDSPWPAGGGKNKFDVETLPTGTDRGVFKLPDGSIKVIAPASSGGISPYKGGFMKLSDVAPTLVVGQTYTLSFISTGTQKQVYLATSQFVWASGSARTITQNDLDSIIYFYASGAGTEAIITDFQIELGSTATSFAPYSNICPISGRTSATVTRTGKNLVDDTIFYHSGVSRRTSGTGANELREFINSLPSGTYTVAFDAVVDAVGDSTKNWEFGFYGTSTFGTIDSIINKVNPAVGSVYRPSVTITKPDGGVINTLYLYAASTSANDLATISKFQLELGSTATTYEPYVGNTYTIQFGDTVYGGTLDVTSGVLTVDRAMVINSSKALKYESANGWYWYSTAVDLGAQSIAGTNAKLICNRLRPSSNVAATSAVGEMSWYANNIIRWKEYGELTQAEYRGYLAENPLQFCYELATPIEITLTPTQIDMLLGENNVWADAGDSTLTYYADGNASTSEALGILLGGTYNNPGGADDVSDDEALGILLGGS